MSAVSLTIEGLDDGALLPVTVGGQEALSGLYSFDVLCLMGDSFDSRNRLLGREAILTLAPEGDAVRRVQGLVDRVWQGADTEWGEAVLRLHIAPALSRFGLSRSSRVFGTVTPVSVRDLLEQDLSGSLRSGGIVPPSGSRILPHQLRLMEKKYPQSDYVVQHEETDLAFLSRHAERWGIFYFFEEAQDGEELVVFGDGNAACRPIPGDATLSYRPWSSGQRDPGAGTLQSLEADEAMAPTRVLLRDYNYNTPSVPLLSQHAVDGGVDGDWMEFGANFQNPEEGDRLAAIRAEELRCRALRFRGRSADARLAPGRRFTLAGHPFADWNQEYLVVEVQHSLSVPRAGAPAATQGYANNFAAIPVSVPFRPEQRTPWPRMEGILNARVDGADAQRPELDTQGRYRVRTPSDFSDMPDGQASTWVRLATPFGGDGDGMHFPLYPGTEVVMGCVNGDPDRPIILGAVPNPRLPSLITSEDRFTNRLASRHGLGIAMRAKAPASTSQTTEGTALREQGAFSGSSSDYTQASAETLLLYRNEESDGSSQALPYAALRLGEKWVGDEPVEEPDTFGAGSQAIENSEEGFALFATGEGAIASQTAIGIYAKDKIEIKTDHTMFTVSGDGAQEIFKVNSNEVKYGASSDVFFGASNEFFFGPKLDIATALVTEIFIGVKMEFNASASFGVQFGVSYDMDFAEHFEWHDGHFKAVPEAFEMAANITKLDGQAQNIVGEAAILAAIETRITASKSEISASTKKLMSNYVSLTQFSSNLGLINNRISEVDNKAIKVSNKVTEVETRLNNARIEIGDTKVNFTGLSVAAPKAKLYI